MISVDGTLQCDGCAAYKGLAAPVGGEDGATLAFCWAHIRAPMPNSVVFTSFRSVLASSRTVHCITPALVVRTSAMPTSPG